MFLEGREKMQKRSIKKGSKAKKSTVSKKRAIAGKKKVTVAKGVKITKAKEKKLEKKAGSSNVGEYKKVSPKEFAGAAGGASKYSYPINTRKRAIAALAYARNAPNPEGIRKKVYAKYPDLNPKNKKKGKK